MADQINPTDAMADIVRGRTFGSEFKRVKEVYASEEKRNGQQPIGFASVRQALDEVQQRLQSVVLASEEVMRFHARPEPMPEANDVHLSGERPESTVWEDLATRAVLLSRSIESLERNLKITLETLR
jgi:hypothetical protein